MNKNGQPAIVLGASMAGLLAARVLADHFERVTLLERDRLPDDDSSRKGVPQGRHAHAVLASGLAAMEQLFPGLTAGLVAGGAMPGDIGRDVRWYQFGGYKLRADVGLPGILLTRPFLEAHIRQRVFALPNVTAIQEAEVQGLLASNDRGRVLGAVLQRRAQPRRSRRWSWSTGITRTHLSAATCRITTASLAAPRPSDCWAGATRISRAVQHLLDLVIGRIRSRNL
jgi:hypothetical protein